MRKYVMRDGKHYSEDPDKLRKAVVKSKETILRKYGEVGLGEKISVEQKDWYSNQRKMMDELDVLSENEVSDFLQGKRNDYKGKSGNRKLIKDNVAVYKSLNKHCEKFNTYNRGKELPFLCKIDIANNGFALDKSMMCPCGKSLKFSKVTQQWDKFYCKSCRRCPSSLSHFKLKYGAEWEIKWKELREKLPVPKGKNEASILDNMEKLNDTIIDRNFSVLEFFPDGYSHELNTIYEVNEKYHRVPSRNKKDIIRRHMIQKTLKCKFVVIWDDAPQIDIYEYVQTK